MPRNPDTKRVNVDLTEDEYALFKRWRKKKDWSDKKLAENIIRGFLKCGYQDEIIELATEEER